MIRQPAVAGRFYPADARELENSVRQLVSEAKAAAIAEQTEAIACLVPHAGYMYSGGVAGAVFARLAAAPTGIPRRVIIIGPRHRPPGAEMAIQSEGAWQTPLGLAPIDTALARALMAACSLLKEDEVAHRREHSIEVEVPFLQVMARDFSFVPIAIGTLNFERLVALGDAIVKVISESSERVLLMASSDLNHHEPDDVTRAKDRFAIEQMLALDPRGLYDAVRRESISMCGVGPAVAALTAAHKLGATRAELIRYATSADAFDADDVGARESVVGYAGMTFC
ncbi:MAG TPA: AmmeMemoRadiSam system protein B [Candidatus Acidoferrum sp.]|nr:AmmeMemoRadiSam system protein B [Candidatus Acidoferrum sp.]